MEEENIKNFRNDLRAFSARFKEELKPSQEEMELFKDPLILGTLMYKLLEERENTNRILKNILQKLEIIETNLKQQKTEKALEADEELLPDQDRKILDYIREKGKVCAADIRQAMSYKGENAASSRLNKLYNIGLLKKVQVGKRVYYLLAEK